MRGSILAAGLLGGLFAGDAEAATVITMAQSVGYGDKTQTIILDTDRLRISTPHGAMLYRGDQEKFFIVNDQAHTYFEMSLDSMQKMQARIQSDLLGGLPEAQRKQVEAKMAARGMSAMGAPKPAAVPPMSYQKSGDPRKAGQWACSPFATLIGGTPISEICVARLSDIGLTMDDLKPFIGLSNLARKVEASLGGGPIPTGIPDYDGLIKAVGYPAYPIQTIRKSASGETEFESTVQSIERKKVPAATFELPAGYTAQDMFGGGKGG